MESTEEVPCLIILRGVDIWKPGSEKGALPARLVALVLRKTQKEKEGGGDDQGRAESDGSRNPDPEPLPVASVSSPRHGGSKEYWNKSTRRFLYFHSPEKLSFTLPIDLVCDFLCERG